MALSSEGTPPTTTTTTTSSLGNDAILAYDEAADGGPPPVPPRRRRQEEREQQQYQQQPRLREPQLDTTDGVVVVGADGLLQQVRQILNRVYASFTLPLNLANNNINNKEKKGEDGEDDVEQQRATSNIQTGDSVEPMVAAKGRRGHQQVANDSVGARSSRSDRAGKRCLQQPRSWWIWWQSNGRRFLRWPNKVSERPSSSMSQCE